MERQVRPNEANMLQHLPNPATTPSHLLGVIILELSIRGAVIIVNIAGGVKPAIAGAFGTTVQPAGEDPEELHGVCGFSVEPEVKKMLWT